MPAYQSATHTLANRHDEQMSVSLTYPDHTPVGMAVLQHGLAGSSDHPLMQALARTFAEAGYTVLNLDCTNSLNESDGDLKDFTIKRHYEDLEDCLEWAAGKEFYKVPYIVAGHSMGGFSILHHAAHYPVLTSAALAIAPVTSGVNLLNAWREYSGEEYEQWQREGYLEKVSMADPGRKGHVPWEAWKEWLLHTLYPLTPDLTMPTCFIHAQDDIRIPPDHLERFIRHVPDPKTYNVLDAGGHSFEDQPQREQLMDTIKAWLGS